MYAENIGVLRMEKCQFKGHKDSELGGAFFGEGMGKLEVIDSSFYNNYAQGYGGAMYLKNSDEVWINGTDFDNNRVDFANQSSVGGCIYAENSNSFGLFGTKIYNSEAYIKGGALFLLSVMKL